MQLLAAGTAAMAAISLMVMVVNWLIAHWWVLVVAALVLVLGGLGWWQHRTQRVQWQQAQARALRYGLTQLDALTHRQFEHAVRDMMHRDGCTDAVQVGGRGDLGADVKATDPYGRRWVLQCKHRKNGDRGAAVGTPDLQGLNGTGRPVHQADVVVMVTNGRITDPAAPSPGNSTATSSTAKSWRNGPPAHAPYGNCSVRYPRHGDRQHTRDSCSTRRVSTDGTLLRIRPTAGSCWANQGKPDRLPATYGRIHGVTYFHGCYSGGDDRLWGVNRRRKGTANTLAALKSIRAALLGEEEQSRAVFHPDVRLLGQPDRGSLRSAATVHPGQLPPPQPSRADPVPARRPCDGATPMPATPTSLQPSAKTRPHPQREGPPLGRTLPHTRSLNTPGGQ
jgi:restriction system protein